MRLKGYDLQATTLKELIRLRAQLGDKPLAIIDEEELTYVETDHGANRIANALIDLGVAKGEVVATYMYNSIDHILVWFACAKIGAIWAPLNISLVGADLTFTVNDAAPKAIVIDDGLLANYTAVRRDVRRPGLLEFVRTTDGRMPPAGWTSLDALLGADVEPDVEVDGTDPAGLIYTGGSTGMPKGVLVANLWYFPGVFRYFEMFTPTEQDVHLGLGQMCHTIGSAVDIIAPMYWQMTTVMYRWFNALTMLDLARKYHTTISVIIGPAIAALLQQPARDDDTDNPIRIAGTGTGLAPRELIDGFSDRFGIPLLELYGQTETGPLGCVSQRVDDRPYHSLGTANGWADVAVVDEADQPCAVDEVGEIVLRPTPPCSFMLGYYGKADKFEQSCRGLWFHSGDLGRIDANGYLHFAGRQAHTISRRGEKISAAEVEELIGTHAAVFQCAVVGVTTEFGDEEIKAYVQLNEGQSVTELDLVEFCNDRMAYFKVPRYIEFVSELPRSVTKGEVERFRLRELGVGQAWDRTTSGYQLRKGR